MSVTEARNLIVKDSLISNTNLLELTDGSETTLHSHAGGGGMTYVDNTDSVIGWDHTTLTMDGTWHDLDLSAIVPVGTVAVNFMVYFRHPTTPGTFGLIRKNGNVNSDNVIASYIYVAGITTRFMGIVACDANRVVEYNFSAGMDLVGICIMGWFV